MKKCVEGTSHRVPQRPHVRLTAHSGEDSDEEIGKLGLVAAALQELKALKKHASGFVVIEQPQQGITGSVVSLERGERKTLTIPLSFVGC